MPIPRPESMLQPNETTLRTQVLPTPMSSLCLAPPRNSLPILVN